MSEANLKQIREVEEESDKILKAAEQEMDKALLKAREEAVALKAKAETDAADEAKGVISSFEEETEKEIATLDKSAASRKEELRKNVSLSHQMDGDEDSDTLHLGIFVKDKLAGIVSLMRASISSFEDEPQYQIRGMATSAFHQSKGFQTCLSCER